MAFLSLATSQSKLIARTRNSLFSTTHIFQFFFGNSDEIIQNRKSSLKDEAKMDHIFLDNLGLHNITMFSKYFFCNLVMTKLSPFCWKTFGLRFTNFFLIGIVDYFFFFEIFFFITFFFFNEFLMIFKTIIL